MLENTPYSNLQRLAAKKKKEAQRRSRLLRHYRKDLVQVGEADSKARSDLTSKKRPRDSNEEGFVMSKPQKKERAEKRQQSTDDRNDPFRKEKRKAREGFGICFTIRRLVSTDGNSRLPSRLTGPDALMY